MTPRGAPPGPSPAGRTFPGLHPGRPARVAGIDLARGLAVCSMVVAHTSPSGIDLPTEYLTAPLFALLIGVGLHLSWVRTRATAPRGAAGAFIVENVARGVVLILIGEALQRAYDPIDIVLQTLGVLTIVLAPLVIVIDDRPALAVAVSALALVVAPFIMGAARDWLEARPAIDPNVAKLTGWLAAGAHYRLTSHLVFGLAGVALGWWFLRGGCRGREGLRALLACAAVTLAAYGVGRVAGRAEPYAGDHYELLGSVAFAGGTAIACVWFLAALGERAALVSPLVATGRVALTAYAVQVLLLAGLRRVSGPGWDDNAWWVLGLTLLVCVGFGWLWTWTRLPGPLEAVIRLPRTLAAPPGAQQT